MHSCKLRRGKQPYVRPVGDWSNLPQMIDGRTHQAGQYGHVRCVAKTTLPSFHDKQPSTSNLARESLAV